MSSEITYLPYRRVFRAPLRTAHGAWSVREGFIVRVKKAGQVGYGEVAPLPKFGTETVAQAESFLRKLVTTPALTVPASLPCCAFALSAAEAGIGVSSSYVVSGLLPAGPRALAVLESKVALGYHHFKWKIGVEPVVEELAILADLASRLPEGGMLRLDANASLDTRSLARWLDAVAALGDQVEYLEQPLAVGDEQEMAAAMASSGVPIALDESLNGEAGAHWLSNWEGPLVIKAALMGDVGQLEKQLKAVAGRLVFSSVFETGVGLANALGLADRVGANKRAIGFDTLSAFDDVLQPLTAAPQLQVTQTDLLSIGQLWQTLLHSK